MADIAHRRLRAQRLVGEPLESPAAVVQRLAGVQAQDYPGARWALAQRSASSTNAEIDELLATGAILRTHVLRPTWHLVTPADIRWLLDLTAPRVHAANAYQYRKAELDERLLARSEEVLREALDGGTQLTRPEVGAALGRAGIEASGLRLGYVLMNAELNAVVCSGALRGKQQTYAAFDDRVPSAPRLDRDEALAALAVRYFTGHGPAQLADFVWWSGLTVADAHAAIGHAGARLAEEEMQGQTHWTGDAEELADHGPSGHLLPNYDEYLIGYKDRSAYATAYRVEPPAGFFYRHILVLDGRVAGAWRVAVTRGVATVTVTPLIRLDRGRRGALDAAVRRYGEAMGTPAELVLA